MDKVTLALGVALVAAVIAIGGYFYPQITSKFGAVGGTSALNSLGLSQLKIASNCNDEFKYGSCSGSAISRLNMGVCYIKPYATTIAASTTATVDCQATAAVGSITGATTALTGVTLGDFVRATLSTTTAAGGGTGGAVSPFGALVLAGADASTTAGYIQLVIDNQTGGTYTWPLTGTATGTVYFTSDN